MSNGRVLATSEARSAVQRLRAILSADLTKTLRDLEVQGDILADPNDWDGGLASQFRSGWPQDKAALKNLQARLDELQQSIDRITQSIMTAGGNT